MHDASLPFHRFTLSLGAGKPRRCCCTAHLARDSRADERKERKAPVATGSHSASTLDLTATRRRVVIRSFAGCGDGLIGKRTLAQTPEVQATRKWSASSWRTKALAKSLCAARDVAGSQPPTHDGRADAHSC